MSNTRKITITAAAAAAVATATLGTVAAGAASGSAQLHAGIPVNGPVSVNTEVIGGGSDSFTGHQTPQYAMSNVHGALRLTPFSGTATPSQRFKELHTVADTRLAFEAVGTNKVVTATRFHGLQLTRLSAGGASARQLWTWASPGLDANLGPWSFRNLATGQYLVPANSGRFVTVGVNPVGWVEHTP
jgi:hypothetical protein